MKHITNDIAQKLGDYFNINFDVIDFDEWKIGLKIELEHGSKVSKLTNITKNNLKMTAKIAIAHLIEDPSYYKYLKKQEDKRDAYWKKHTKPTIFN